jgi:two-component system, OmpR family, response regulator ChvI
VSFPPEQSCALLRRLRTRGIVIPVFFLPALSDDIYEEAALAGGLSILSTNRGACRCCSSLQLITDGTRPFGDAEPPPANGLVLTSTERPGQESA